MHRLFVCALTSLAISLSLLAAPGTAPSSSAEGGSSMSVSPAVFVGGQQLTFTGTVSGASNAKLQLQTLFSRAGDSWSTRDGIVAVTDTQGDFSFTYPAPNNFGISYRVITVGGVPGAARVLEPRQQELVLSLNGGPEQAPGAVISGQSFTIDVDTTPVGRGDLGRPAPAFPDRHVVLEQRVRGDQWQSIDSSVTDARGTARFVLSASEVGSTAYRVVQREIVTAGHRIGWFPSYPLLVDVLAPGSALPSLPTRSPLTPIQTGANRHSSATPLASSRYLWGPPQYDFAWEEGESLTDKPFRGSRLTGAWRDRSDGSGRVAHYNGGMALSSNVSEFPGAGDLGNVSATLEGNPITYGRWEFRRRIDIFEHAGSAYRVLIELVPARAEDAKCGSNTITVADVAYNSETATMGVSSLRAGSSWTGTRPIRQVANGPHSFAVEVTRDHVTWFLDGQSLATVKGRDVAPGVPLTPRLSLVADGSAEMQRTRVLYDWQRGWPLNKQARTASRGPSLKSANLPAAC